MVCSKQNFSDQSNSDKADKKAGKILLIGDISKAFLNTDSLSGSDIEIYSAMQAAIEAASSNDISAIAIIMSGIQAKLNSSLKTLKDKSGARIILLAQMYEEPIAIRFLNSIYNDKPLVDEYFICPVQVESFLESCHSPQTTDHGSTELVVRPRGSRRAEVRPQTTRTQDITSPETQDIRPKTQDTDLLSDAALRSEDSLQSTSVYGLETKKSEALESRIRNLEKLATEDDLTGLKNRRYIREFTKQIIEYARNEKGRVTLLLFDIDDFKKYNDTYGHTAGDEILKQAGRLMLRCCRPHDVVARYGGDEFAVVFWDDPSILKAVIEQSKASDRRSIDSDHPHEAMVIARRFINELDKFRVSSLVARDSGIKNSLTESRDTRHLPRRTEIDGLDNTIRVADTAGESRVPELGPEGTGTLTISGGLASFPRDGDSVQELFDLADKALLEAKRSGKNRIYLVGKP